jgi:hypothetical protein
MSDLWLNDDNEKQNFNIKIPEEIKKIYFQDNSPSSDFEKLKDDNENEKKNGIETTSKINNLDHLIDQLIDSYIDLKNK